MKKELSEQAFEEAIERALLAGGPDDPGATGRRVAEADVPWNVLAPRPGGYVRRTSADYDRDLALVPRDVIDFVVATQPREWKRLREFHGSDTETRFLQRLKREIDKKGTVHVLRRGIKDHGIRFRLAWFRPETGLNEETRRLYETNVFAIARQLHFSKTTDQSVDLVLFLNGLPIFTAELKNLLTGQGVRNAIRQYKRDRDPREPLFAPGRCLAHFAVDPYEAYVATVLEGPRTRFLPFNRGARGGAGNPEPEPGKFATAYLWEEVWARDSVLDLLQWFVHEVEERDEGGRRRRRRLVFPRYHQLEAVRRLIAHAREHGPGQRYLVEHSAGSGKSLTIAWLAHRLAALHDASDRRVFDSIVIVTDRRVLDRQLRRTVQQLEQTPGLVEAIDQTSRQLREALEAGRQIIVTTLQKFPVIVDEISQLPGQRFAVIIDEAHSSQSGESSRSLREVLSAGSLEEAAAEEEDAPTPEDEVEEEVLRTIRTRGRQPNLSMFAFTATPKPKTLELFGTPRPEGGFAPFHVYGMRQAIEEGFILDVLRNYTTYRSYWRLQKKIQDDPKVDRRRAASLLRTFVELHPHAIREKVAIMVEHFRAHVADRIDGTAKAMIVTRSRLHAVRTKLALDEYLREQGYPWRSLVAFSGTVRDGGRDYTEAGMNTESAGYPIGERQTAQEFRKPEFRFLVVANKFQTGFDEPLLCAMYVDKKLGGVNAVQTLSRLNRIHPGKRETLVLDFANEAEAIRKAFEPYYETTILSEATDPNLLYDVQDRLLGYPVFGPDDIEAFAREFFGGAPDLAAVYRLLEPVAERARALEPEERRELRGDLDEYVRLYAFLSQVIPFADPDLEKLYHFARALLRVLPREGHGPLPREVLDAVDIESYRVRRTRSGRVVPERGAGVLDPRGEKEPGRVAEPELEPLSRIIEELNRRFGAELGEQHRETLARLRDRIVGDEAFVNAARVSPRENVRLAFDQKVDQRLQEIVRTDFEFFRRVSDDPEFGRALRDLLFEEVLRVLASRDRS